MDKNSTYTNLKIDKQFIGWQCRLREYLLRNNGGRPTEGISPSVLSLEGYEISSSIILLLLPQKKMESVKQFRFIAKKTNDPNERYKKAIQLLSSNFFQKIDDFDGEMTGLFSKESLTASKIKKHKKCYLDFYYQKQSFKIFTIVEELNKEDMGYQLTFWHNFLFNSRLSPTSRVLRFKPDWSASIANRNSN